MWQSLLSAVATADLPEVAYHVMRALDQGVSSDRLTELSGEPDRSAPLGVPPESLSILRAMEAAAREAARPFDTAVRAQYADELFEIMWSRTVPSSLPAGADRDSLDDLRVRYAPPQALLVTAAESNRSHPAPTTRGIARKAIPVSRKPWTHVRNQFTLSPDHVNFAGLALSSHPKPVARAIKRFREGLDRDPYLFLKSNLHAAEDAVAAKAAVYFGVPSGNIALTDGTTSGMTLLYAGLKFKPGQEILTTQHEFSGILRIFDYLQARQGTPTRRISLIEDSATITKQDILDRLRAAVQPSTRVLALTWVYSNSGVKLPLAEIAAWLRPLNETREPDDRVLLCIDGVHGFGVENETFTDLGCDFFVSGCHKGICGPRGTGIWCGTSDAWAQYHQVAPTSSRDHAGVGRSKSPGGVQCYEHRWALEVAFEFLIEIGKDAIEQHIHGLASEMKDELSQMPGVTVVTPRSEALSSGIICFDVDGVPASDAVEALAANNIIATQSSIDAGAERDIRHVRLSVSLYNTRAEVDRCLEAIRDYCRPTSRRERFAAPRNRLPTART
jgi:isopenicillin-N epimerase